MLSSGSSRKRLLSRIFANYFKAGALYGSREGESEGEDEVERKEKILGEDEFTAKISVLVGAVLLSLVYLLSFNYSIPAQTLSGGNMAVRSWTD